MGQLYEVHGDIGRVTGPKGKRGTWAPGDTVRLSDLERCEMPVERLLLIGALTPCKAKAKPVKPVKAAAKASDETPKDAA